MIFLPKYEQVNTLPINQKALQTTDIFQNVEQRSDFYLWLKRFHEGQNTNDFRSHSYQRVASFPTEGNNLLKTRTGCCQEALKRTKALKR